MQLKRVYLKFLVNKCILKISLFRIIVLMDIRKIIKLHHLIKNERTGKPSELAGKLGVSERSVYNYIGFMKMELNAPISYEENKESYCYESDCEFNIEGFTFN